MNEPLQLWFEECHEDFVSQRFRITDTLFSGRSDFQQIDVVKTAGHGRMLVIDGKVMLTEREEFVYHEMISHVPLFVMEEARNVLVIGGGDGGTVREVIRHKHVEHCRLVEIDPMVVDVSRRFLSQTSACLDDSRVTVDCRDGVKFVAETDETFDLIIIDSTDPIGPATPLFGPDFYGNVRRILNARGVVVAQGESPYYEAEWQKTVLASMGTHFTNTFIYNYSNLSYPGGLWSFALASATVHPLRDFDPSTLEASGMSFRYYNADIHRAAFCLPQFQRTALQGLLTQP